MNAFSGTSGAAAQGTSSSAAAPHSVRPSTFSSTTLPCEARTTRAERDEHVSSEPVWLPQSLRQAALQPVGQSTPASPSSSSSSSSPSAPAPQQAAAAAALPHEDRSLPVGRREGNQEREGERETRRRGAGEEEEKEEITSYDLANKHVEKQGLRPVEQNAVEEKVGEEGDGPGRPNEAGQGPRGPSQAGEDGPEEEARALRPARDPSQPTRAE